MGEPSGEPQTADASKSGDPVEGTTDQSEQPPKRSSLPDIAENEGQLPEHGTEPLGDIRETEED